MGALEIGPRFNEKAFWHPELMAVPTFVPTSIEEAKNDKGKNRKGEPHHAPKWIYQRWKELAGKASLGVAAKVASSSAGTTSSSVPQVPKLNDPSSVTRGPYDPPPPPLKVGSSQGSESPRNSDPGKDFAPKKGINPCTPPPRPIAPAGAPVPKATLLQTCSASSRPSSPPRPTATLTATLETD